MASSADNGGGNGNGGDNSNAYTTLGYLRLAREWISPTLKTSAFLEKGVLTPEEFIKAGDELVFRCPTWTWEMGDPQRTKAWLPREKQYLVTKNVPCQTRVADMEKQFHDASNQKDNIDEDDWLISTILKQSNEDDDDDDEAPNMEDDFDILDEDGEVVVQTPPTPPAVPAAPETTTPAANGGGGDDDDEYADMADFEDDNILMDEDAAVAVAPTTTTTTETSSQQQSTTTKNNVVKVRTYDLSITYDKYFQTPRLWMVGTSSQGQPLTGVQMMEDVMTDYANKTVTIEAHPHVAGPHASIHPCKHSRVMKTIVQNLIQLTEQTKISSSSSEATDGSGNNSATTSEGGGDVNSIIGPSVEMYLFIFLKFVSSIIPTINYDFTLDVTVK